MPPPSALATLGLLLSPALCATTPARAERQGQDAKPVAAAGAADDGTAGVSSFLAVGDWGGAETSPFTLPVQLQVADAMGKAADETTDFVFALGDNFYTHGISCTNAPKSDTHCGDARSQRFQHTFEEVYTAPSLQLPWYVVLGNHDHYGNATAQVAYAAEGRGSGRWKLPALSSPTADRAYYDFTRTLGGVKVHVVVLDTVVLAGDCFPGPGGEACAPPKLADTPEARLAADAQLQWAEGVMRASTADWLLVAGHYPVWSVGEHGPTQVLIDGLKPLLEEYGVPLYLNGHDHNLQHLTDGGVHYFDCGAGQYEEDNKDHASAVPEGSLQFFRAVGGFCRLTIKSDDALLLEMIDKTNEVVHSVTVGNSFGARRRARLAAAKAGKAAKKQNGVHVQAAL